jgi:uncharacterized protein (DUF1778 family)
MPNVSITVRLSAEDKVRISSYARVFGQSVSEFIRESALARIEDDLDLQAWDEAKAEYDNEPLSYSAQEMAEKYL